MFYEYFHGDTGAGGGASRQTGWSGAITRIMHLCASSDAHEMPSEGNAGSVGKNPLRAGKT